MKYDLKRPCADCPFRHDKPGFLREERAEEIIEGIIDRQGTFACHKTLDYDGGEDGEGEETGRTQHCAGALILLEQIGQPNQMMRIMERLGGYDHRALDMTAPVFHDPDDFIDHHAKA